uniref:G-patch domain-containing protein n=1 Tax=Parastrongyloides trichosuri TaxID=131310 RepID=A0A0N4Z4K3_PARTI
MKISFSLKADTKKEELPKRASIFDNDSTVNNDSDDEVNGVKKLKIRGFENGEIDGESEEEVIIDLADQKKDDWKINKLKKRLEEEELNDEEKARLLLMIEALGGNVNGKEDDGDNGEVIKKDVAEIEDDAEDANYDRIRVKDFGLAILRGCGWKKGEGIGKDKKVVKVEIPKIRPKGLGLGADPGKKKKKIISEDGKTVEELELKKGSYVKFLHGRYAERYGTVENINDDLARVYVKLTLGGNKVDVGFFNVEVVSRSEYDKNSKILNKDKYDKVKKEENGEKNHCSKSGRDSDRVQKREYRRRSRSPSSEVEKDCKRSRGSHSSKYHDSKDSESRRQRKRKSSSDEEYYSRRSKRSSNDSRSRR